MRGMGNKCLRKAVESFIMSALLMVVAYQTGILEELFKRYNPHLFEQPIAHTLDV